MPPFLAGDQGLTPTLQRLSRITKHEYPNYASLSQPAPPPIIDSSPLSDSGNQENVDDRGDREHANTSHILGLARLHGEIRREYERVEKFLKSDEGWESRPPLSTNAPYLIAVWDELIASRGVTAVGKIFKLPKKADGTSLVRGKIPGVSNESIKVDVVSEFGKKWTRVITLTAGRFMRELDEIESSDSDSEPEPTTTQVEDPSTSHQSLESSLVAQGRRFVLTADSFDSTTTPAQRGRAVVGVGVVRSIRPQIIFRLTRLASAVCTAGPAPEGSQDASNVDKKRDLSRILRHVDKLKALGITVLLDEQDGEIGDRLANMKLVKTPISFYHTLKINLDLSAVVALCSEITHMGPPENPSIAEERFRPWRQLLLSDSDGVEEALDDGGGDDDDGVDNGGNSVEHARSLIAQSIQEAKLPLLEEIRQKAIDAIAFHSGRGVPSPSSSNYSVGPSERSPSIEFWTTPEVKHRAFGIVDKIGGQNERARARALFEAPSPIEGEEHCASGSQSFWTSSRYPKDFIPSLHVQLFPSDVPESFYLSPASPDSGTVERDASGSELKGAEFWTHLGRTAASLAGLHSGQPISNPLDSSQLPSTESRTKPNSKGLRSAITKHTALSFLWGSQMHMTTVTANRASVKALLREMDATAELKPFTNPLVSEEGGVTREEIREEAAIWIIRPRSLAEASVVTPPPPRSHDFTRLIS